MFAPRAPFYVNAPLVVHVTIPRQSSGSGSADTFKFE